MAVDPQEPTYGSPEYWLKRLYGELTQARPGIMRLEDYYDGRHPLAFATPKFRAAFGNLFSAFADNWCDLVVDASVERLEVQGFRPMGSDEADTAAWDTWKRNYLDADSGLAMLEAVKTGRSYAIVAPPARGSDHHRITVEHPSQVIVATSPENRRERLAALKAWQDDSGHIFATVYLADAVYKFQSRGTVDTAGAISVEWEPRRGVVHIVPHAYGVVPVVPLENTPTMLGGGKSDLEKVIPLQNAVNKLVADMIVASEYAAMPQRWATGIEIPTDPETERPMATDKFLSFVGRVWTVEDPEAKFGQFSAGDLDNYVKAVAMIVQHLSAQTRTPPHYLVGQIVNATGDALKAAETGLVSKVKRKHGSLGTGWGEVIRLGQGADPEVRYEPIWKDPESRSVAEITDAALKRQKLGVPDEALWAFIGASPTEISEWRAHREAQTLAAQALAFAGVTPGGQGLPPEPGADPAASLPPAAPVNGG